MLFWVWESTELESWSHELLNSVLFIIPRCLLLGTKVDVTKQGAAVFEFLLYFLWWWSNGNNYWSLNEIPYVTVAGTVEQGLDSKNQQILTF